MAKDIIIQVIMQTQIRIKQSQMIGRLREGIKLKQKMVDLEVPMRIPGALMWEVTRVPSSIKLQ